MDPNANLEEQRRIFLALKNPRKANGTQALQLWKRLADLAEAMDDWLTHGGFLPKAWGVRIEDSYDLR